MEGHRPRYFRIFMAVACLVGWLIWRIEAPSVPDSARPSPQDPRVLIARLEAELQALPSDAGRAPLLIALGRAHSSFGQVEAALSRFEAAQLADPESPIPLFEAARCHLARQGPDKAVALLEKAVQKDPAHEGSVLLLGQAFMARGQGDAALKLFTEALRRKEAPSFLASLGQYYAGQDAVEIAEGYFQRALKLDPGDPHLLASLGELCLREPRRPKEAVLHLEGARKAGLENPKVLLGLANALTLDGQAIRAEKVLDEVERSSPQPLPDLFIQRIATAVALKDFTRARAYLSRPELRALPAWMMHGLGARVAFDAGDHASSIQQNQEVVEDPLAPTAAQLQALIMQGDAQLASGNPRRAIETFQEAGHRFGKEEDLLARLAVAHFQAGDPLMALDEFDQAVRFGRELSEAQKSIRQQVIATVKRGTPEGMKYAFRLTDVTRRSGVRFTHYAGYPLLHAHQGVGPGVVVLDYDADGFEDLYFASGRNVLVGIEEDEPPPDGSRTGLLYRNRGDGTFEERTELAGLGKVMAANAAAGPDLDEDGYPELVIAGAGEFVIFRNMGDGLFREDTRRFRVQHDPTSNYAGISFGDLDRDGFLDGYVCGYTYFDAARLPREPPLVEQVIAGRRVFSPPTINAPTLPGGSDLLLHNHQGTWLESRRIPPPAQPGEDRSMMAVIADIRNTGKPDILIVNDEHPARLLVDSGAGSWVDEASRRWIADQRGGMGVAMADHDQDQDLDIFMTHFASESSALYRNLHPKPLFQDVLMASGITKEDPAEVGWGANLVDLDCDGQIDLFVVNGGTYASSYDPGTYLTTARNLLAPQKPLIYRGDGRRFSSIRDEIGLGDVEWSARSSAAFDFDHDGDLDMVIGNNSTPAVLLENQGDHGNWLVLELVGSRSNRQAVGARVTVTAGGKAQIREVLMGSSYLAQETLLLHLGLEEAQRVDEIRVRWPTGQEEIYPGRTTNAYYRLRESAS